jgi:hypothetical protein
VQANKKNPGKITPKFFSTCLFIQIPCLTNDMKIAGRKDNPKRFFCMANGTFII